MITRQFTLGDRITSVYASLWHRNGVPVELTVGDDVAFRMVDESSGAVKVNNAGAVIVSYGSSTAPAYVRYDWAAADVDTAGTYVAWFVRTAAGLTEHFPTQSPDDPQFRIIIWATT